VQQHHQHGYVITSESGRPSLIRLLLSRWLLATRPLMATDFHKSAEDTLQ
jgi:hypothetical protein